MISHKLLRLLVPFALFGVFFSCVFGPALLLPILILQVIFYGLAGYGLLSHKRGSRSGRLFVVPMTFCLLNAAALRAFVVYFFQKKSPVWK